MWIWLILIGIGAVGAYFSMNRALVATVGGLLFGAYALYSLLTNPIGALFSFLTLGAVPLITLLFGFMIGAGITYVSYWIMGKLTGKLERD
jgi:hypothetical protein